MLQTLYIYLYLLFYTFMWEYCSIYQAKSSDIPLFYTSIVAKYTQLIVIKDLLPPPMHKSGYFKYFVLLAFKHHSSWKIK